MTSCRSPPVLHGMSLVHFICRHNTVRNHEPVERDELSGMKLWLLCHCDWNERLNDSQALVSMTFVGHSRTFYAPSQHEIGYSDIICPIDIVRITLGVSTRVSKACQVVVPFIFNGILRYALWEKSKIVIVIAAAFWLADAASFLYGLHLFPRLPAWGLLNHLVSYCHIPRVLG